MRITKRDREAFRRVGRAAARAQSASMTPEQRKVRASNAARARWAKLREMKARWAK